MDTMVLLQVERALRTITESLGRGPVKVVRNLDQITFTGSTENTRLMPAFRREDLDVNQDRKTETRHVENTEDGVFPHENITMSGDYTLITY